MYRVHFPLADLKRAARNNQQAIEQEIADILEVLGIQLLSLIQLDYEVKSRGGSGAGGVTWKPLKPETAKRKGRRGRRNRNRRTTASGRRRPRAGQTAIGVDTGLQRASATPGYRAPDGEGGNVFELGATDVTVGFGRSYSQYFDDERELIPEPLPMQWQHELDLTASEMLEEVVHF